MKLFYTVPLWVIWLFTLVIILIFFEIGFLIGRYRVRRSVDKKDTPLGPIIASTLGLLAFILSFTFGMSATHLDARKQALANEVDAIRTTYLRARLLPEPFCTQSQELIREYVSFRIPPDKLLASPEMQQKIEQGIAKAEEIHRVLWDQVSKASLINTGSRDIGLYISPLNDMINLHFRRVDIALRSYIPPIIWFSLYGIMMLSLMLVGYQAGLVGKRGLFGSFVLALAFSTVILLIIGLDRSQLGLTKVSQQAMVDLQRMMLR